MQPGNRQVSVTLTICGKRFRPKIRPTLVSGFMGSWFILRYPPHLISNASGRHMENSETIIWLEFTVRCNNFADAFFTVCNNQQQQ